jgi:serine/threonine protein kinase
LCIGTGAFSEVFRVRRKTDNIEYALKKVMHGYSSQKYRLNLESSTIKKKTMHSMKSEYLLLSIIPILLRTRRHSSRKVHRLSA